MKVAAVGECTLDHYVDQAVARVGGISLNFAVQARLAGAERVHLVSATGTDDAAAAVRSALRQAGVITTHVRTLPGHTATQAILLVAGGERVFPPGGYDPGVLADLQLDDGDMDLLRAMDVIALPVFRQLHPLVDPLLHATDLHASRVADLLDGEDLGPEWSGLEPLLDAFDVLFLSGDVHMAHELLALSRDTRTLLVVTHGPQGSSALHRGRQVTAPAERVPPDECLDSTGCGDAFQAAFTVHYLRTGDVAASLRAGAHHAAQVIRHLGAIPYPSVLA